MPRFILAIVTVAVLSGCAATESTDSKAPASGTTQANTFSSADDNFDGLRVTDRYQSLLLAGGHEAIEARLAPCLEAAPIGLAEVHCFRKLDNVMSSINFDLRDALYEWLDESPDSYIANIWLAANLNSAAWDIRGNEYSSETLTEHMEAHYTLLQDAIHFAETAREIRPSLPYAYALLVEYYGIGGRHGDLGEIRFQEALDRHPETYIVRYRRLGRLEPRWGGSYQAIEDLVAASEPHWEANPLLRELAFYPLMARSRDLWTGHGVTEDRETAFEGYQQAQSLAPSAPSVLSRVAYAHRHFGDTNAFLNTVEQSIRMSGATQSTLNLAWSAALNSEVPLDTREHYMRLGADYNPDSTRWQYRMGYFLHQIERHEEALEYLAVALQQQPFHIFAERTYRQAQQALGQDVPNFNQDQDYLNDYLEFVYPADHYLEQYRTILHEALLEQHPGTDPEKLEADLNEAMDHRELRDGMRTFWSDTDMSVDQLNVLTTVFAEIRYCACYYVDRHVEDQLETSREDPFYAELDERATDYGWNLFLQAVDRYFLAEQPSL